MPGVFSGMCNSLQSTGLTNQTRLLHGPPNFHLGNEGYERHWRGSYASESWVPSSCRWVFKNLHLSNYLLSPVVSKWRIGFWNLRMAVGWVQNTCVKAQKIPWENKMGFSSSTSEKDCDQQSKQLSMRTMRFLQIWTFVISFYFRDDYCFLNFILPSFYISLKQDFKS